MSGSVGFQPVQLYQQYAANESTYATASMRGNPQDSGLIAYFNANSAGIATPAQLLGNYKILSVVLGAFNLQGSIGDTALLKQLMTQDPTSKTSLAQRLQNAKYLLFAQALSNWTSPPFATAASRAQIVSSYTTNVFEQTADTQAPGLANALYFTREVPNIKTITGIQSDPQLLKVAVASTGVPYDDFAQLSFGQQTTLLTKKLKLSQFQTPSYVKQMAEQYLVQQTSTSNATPPPGSIGSLFYDGTDTSGDGVLSILDPGANLATGDTNSGSLLSLFA
jgi:hypothetical protein